MQILTEKPSVADKIFNVFGVDYNKGDLIISYAPHIHTKKGYLTPDLEAHEGTHLVQQSKIGTENWWNKFFDDPKFRLEQELEAYRNQYEYLKQNIKDRNKLYQLRTFIAKQLAGEMYGHILTTDEALKLIV